jgi:hypothetical protein
MPAIEVELALFDESRKLLEGYRETVLRVGEEIEFRPILDEQAEGKYYIVCQYKQVSSDDDAEVFSQTWYPLYIHRASKVGEVIVVAGELEFKPALSKNDKICIFTRKI